MRGWNTSRQYKPRPSYEDGNLRDPEIEAKADCQGIVTG